MPLNYNSGNVDIPNAIQRLENNLLEFPERFLRFSEEEILEKPAPGKWSKKEILGHLVDSAINNLKRFTDVQALPQPCKLVQYRQNELVSINRYQQVPLEHVLEMWRSLNKQIVYVVRNTDAEKFELVFEFPNDERELKTFGWVFCDYVGHMEHHFRQIF